MDSMEISMSLSPHMGEREHLSIYINGVRLDEILATVDETYFGLIPAWVDEYDESYEPNMREKRYVLEKTKLSDRPTELPIMLCPDDFDFSCTVIVVEVICAGNTVIWSRFGADVTIYDADETELPKYIGKKVDWFSGIGPFTFSKQIYMDCILRFPMMQSLRIE